MSERKASNSPWDKTLDELSKYDWATAVGLSPAHKNRPLELRAANALMQHANSSFLAWPSQQTLMRFMGVADERQVRTAVASLASSGALARVRISQLDEDSRKAVERTGRGVAYRLIMFWAYEVFEADPKHERREPSHLRIAKDDRTTLVLSANDDDRTTVVRSDRTTLVRCQQDYGSPPNTKGKLRDTEEAAKVSQDLASTREGNAYAMMKEVG